MHTPDHIQTALSSFPVNRVTPTAAGDGHRVDLTLTGLSDEAKIRALLGMKDALIEAGYAEENITVKISQAKQRGNQRDWISWPCVFVNKQTKAEVQARAAAATVDFAAVLATLVEVGAGPEKIISVLRKLGASQVDAFPIVNALRKLGAENTVSQAVLLAFAEDVPTASTTVVAETEADSVVPVAPVI